MELGLWILSIGLGVATITAFIVLYIGLKEANITGRSSNDEAM